MNPLQENNTPDTEDQILDPGTIVTVAGADWIDEPPDRPFVVIDGFKAPLYTIAVLGGDGFQYPNQPRELLTVVTPARIVLDEQADLPGYLIA